MLITILPLLLAARTSQAITYELTTSVTNMALDGKVLSTAQVPTLRYVFKFPIPVQGREPLTCEVSSRQLRRSTRLAGWIEPTMELQLSSEAFGRRTSQPPYALGVALPGHIPKLPESWSGPCWDMDSSEPVRYGIVSLRRQNGKKLLVIRGTQHSSRFVDNEYHLSSDVRVDALVDAETGRTVELSVDRLRRYPDPNPHMRQSQPMQGQVRDGYKLTLQK